MLIYVLSIVHPHWWMADCESSEQEGKKRRWWCTLIITETENNQQILFSWSRIFIGFLWLRNRLWL